MEMAKSATTTSTQEIKTKKKMGLWQLWREDVRCVFERDPAARNSFEVLTTYPGVHAILIHRFCHTLWVRGWRYLPRFLAFLSRMFTNIDIHPGATIGRRFFIDHGIGVVIGETAVVGHDVTLYHGVTLGGTSWNKGKRHPTLGDNVLVGAGAKILGSIDIGENVRVGANSVVVKDVPPDCSVVGIPGKVVKGERDKACDTSHIHGIDLDHHLIPDPVGKAMVCMLERIAHLEKQLNTHIAEENTPDKERCDACDALEVCVCEETDHEPRVHEVFLKIGNQR